MKKGGLIGCGFFAQNHLHAWRGMNGAEIVAICDRDPERVSEAASAFGIARTYSDAGAMLEAEDLDFVDIATTVSTHRPLVELAASHGRHIICQKPFAESLEDGAAMVAACRKAGVHLMVHENFRWQSAIRAVKKRLEAGVVGRPHVGSIGGITHHPGLVEDRGRALLTLGHRGIDRKRLAEGEPVGRAIAAQRAREGEKPGVAAAEGLAGRA